MMMPLCWMRDAQGAASLDAVDGVGDAGLTVCKYTQMCPRIV